MRKVAKIHPTKQPRRPHFIREWAEHRGYTNQSELASTLACDKSTVSRWYDGASPDEESQKRLAALFDCDRDAIFRHPEEDWMWRWFRSRSDDEIKRAKAMLEAAFPLRDKTGTHK